MLKPRILTIVQASNLLSAVPNRFYTTGEPLEEQDPLYISSSMADPGADTVYLVDESEDGIELPNRQRVLARPVNQHLEVIGELAQGYDWVARTTAATPFHFPDINQDMLRVNDEAGGRPGRLTLGDAGVIHGIELVDRNSLSQLLGLVHNAENATTFVSNLAHLHAHGGFPGFYLSQSAVRQHPILDEGTAGVPRGGFAEQFGPDFNRTIPLSALSPEIVGKNAEIVAQQNPYLHISGLLQKIVEEDTARVATVFRNFEGLGGGTIVDLTKDHADSGYNALADDEKKYRFAGAQATWQEWRNKLAGI